MTAHDFDSLLAAMRPALHRYCARMTGSTIDGEDVVQETMLKAFAGREAAGPLDNPQGWLFRIAHNCALDFLRRRQRAAELGTQEELAMVAAVETVILHSRFQSDRPEGIAPSSRTAKTPRPETRATHRHRQPRTSERPTDASGGRDLTGMEFQKFIAW